MLDDGTFSQLERGTIADRPWGRTLAALARSSRSVLITLRAEDEKVYRIALDHGVVTAASSPCMVDSAIRVALTGHFITPAIAQEVRRRIAAAPHLDEVEALVTAARLQPEQVRALLRRLVTQRAARTFAVERGTYEVAERAPRPRTEEGIAVGAIILAGAQMHLSDERLATELRQLGARFALPPGATGDFSPLGLADAELPVIEALRGGTSAAELEATHRDLDPRLAQAILYTLAACGALVAAPPRSAPAPAPIAAPIAIGRATTEHGAPVAGRSPSLRPPAPARPVPSIVRPAAPVAPVAGPAIPPLPAARRPSARPRTEEDVPPDSPETAAVSRAMLDGFLSNRTTAVRAPALDAREVVALIERKIALHEGGADHFALLGLDFEAAVEDVHGAYVELARHLQPARLAELGISDEGFLAQRLLAQLGIAFTVLTDRILRPEYVASLAHARRRRASGER